MPQTTVVRSIAVLHDLMSGHQKDNELNRAKFDNAMAVRNYYEEGTLADFVVDKMHHIESIRTDRATLKVLYTFILVGQKVDSETMVKDFEKKNNLRGFK